MVRPCGFAMCVLCYTKQAEASMHQFSPLVAIWLINGINEDVVMCARQLHDIPACNKPHHVA